MKLLIHICCAPCFIYPYQVLQEKNYDLFGFFFNPNIHPYQEYIRRLKTLQNWSKDQNIKLIYKNEYLLEEFLRGVVYRENERCLFCYYLRLKATAQIALKGKFDAFTTTLLYSKFQKHEAIAKIGAEIEKECGVVFYYQDFRKGWKEGIMRSKKSGLYRQQYCGCIYSEKERYMPKVNNEQKH